MPRDPKAAPKAAREKAAREKVPDGPLSVPLDGGRTRHLIWFVATAAIGGALLIFMGILAQLLGAALLVLAAVHGWRALRTFLYEGRRIEIGTDQLTLPTAACGGTLAEIPVADIHHVFFLRHAASWAATGPVLVIETADSVRTYPRHWFLSEADQRQVASTIRRRLDGSTSRA